MKKNVKKTIPVIIRLKVITIVIVFLASMTNKDINKRSTYLTQVWKDQVVHIMNLGDTKKVIMTRNVLLGKKMKTMNKIWMRLDINLGNIISNRVTIFRKKKNQVVKEDEQKSKKSRSFNLKMIWRNQTTKT